MIDKITSIKFHGEYHYPYVREDGIYVPVVYSDKIYDQCIITKEMFVEAYNKWIKNDRTSKYDCLFNRQDELDNWWSDD